MRETDNDALMLAAEILLDDGDFPRVSVPRSCISHWNGIESNVDFANILALIGGGLIDIAGRWTEDGRDRLVILANAIADGQDSVNDNNRDEP